MALNRAKGVETMQETKHSVAVVVPVYRMPLDPDETTSLRHLRHHLGRYDRIFLAPEGLSIGDSYGDFAVRRFAPEFFRSKASYSRLLLSRPFYEAFADYEYILIHQLDCLVFSDRLSQWCEEGYDYVGAPWYRPDGGRKSEWHPCGTMVGNGGLSLRRVSRFILALDVYARAGGERERIIHNLLWAPAYAARCMAVLCRSIAGGRGVKPVIAAYRERLECQVVEDVFWSAHARRFVPDFRIPPPDKAVSFSIEENPRRCFELNNRRLPFGCHGWAKTDRAFWETYLLR